MQMILCLCLMIVMSYCIVCQRLLHFYQGYLFSISIPARYVSSRLHRVLIFLVGCIFHIIKYRAQRQDSGCINGFATVRTDRLSRHISAYCRTATRISSQEKWRIWDGCFCQSSLGSRQNILNEIGYWSYAVKTYVRARGGIGIRKGLKIPGCKACGFDSHRAHHVKRSANAGRFAFASRHVGRDRRVTWHSHKEYIFLLAHLNRLCFTESTRL